VDKTPFLPVVERAESGYAYTLFLRPRRIGKSVFVSLLEHYYDVARADEFDALFGGALEHVFNSDMVLYFLSELDRRHDFPEDMLDFNARTDYRGLQRIGAFAGAAAAGQLSRYASDERLVPRLTQGARKARKRAARG
jgi:hypothetical protein